MDSASNGSLGQPTLPLRELYVPAVLELLLVGASDLQATRVVDPSMSENRISALLDQQMRATRMAGNGSDIISWHMRTLIPKNLEGPPELVEPDFLFTWGAYPSREHPCLYIEAKRLRGAGSSLAGDYVDEGVVRFVNGSYGRGHDYGVMVGYVVVAPVSSAVSRVKTAMDQRKSQTHQLSGFAPDSSLCAYPATHHSCHWQQVATQAITLVHIFIDFS